MKSQIVTDAFPEAVFSTSSKISRGKIRFLNSNVPVEIAIYTDNRVHMAVFSNREDIYRTDVVALTSNHPCFVSMLQNYFETLWNAAKPKNP